MDKPFCRLCRHRHYASEDHIWSEAGAASVASPPDIVRQLNNQNPPAISIKSSGKFDRPTYQKLYMRQWRARQAQAQAASLSS